MGAFKGVSAKSITSLCLGLLLLICARPAFPQGVAATISGLSKDETGAILPGVTIVIKNLDTGVTRTVVSDEAGRYRAPGLPLGNYELEASLPGFKTEVRRGVKLTVGREAVVDFVLPVGEIEERVVVVGEAALVETASSTLGELVDERKIRDLPLNLRDVAQLVLLQPGIQLYKSTDSNIAVSGGRGVRISTAGVRYTGNLFMLDGTVINNLGNRTAAGAAGQITGIETIKEFKVLSNTYSAEYGRATGGVFNIVTKSGTNEFHGSAYWFHRNDNLDARNFFDRGDPPEFKRNQFGFSAGGPIIKDRTFAFGSYEGLRESLGLTVIRTVPDADAHRGIVRGKLVGIKPEVKPYLDLYPLPTVDPIPGDGAGLWFGSFSQESDEDFFTARIDHRLSESDFLMGRYTFSDSSLTLLSPDVFPQFSNAALNRLQYLTLEHKKIFSPAVLNEFRFGFSRTNPREDINPDSEFRELAFIPGQPIGTIDISGFNRMGTERNLPRRLTQNLFQYADNLSITRGRHVLKLGFNVERLQYNLISASRDRGEFRFRNLEDFLRARVRTFEGNLPEANDATRGYRQTLYSWYFQDDIKLTPRFTLNLGIRHEFATVPSEENGKLNNLRDPLDPEIIIGKPFVTSKDNFAPRLGFSWDPTGSGKTAIRGGFGIFHDPFIGYQWWNSIVRLPPFAITARASGAEVTFPDATSALKPLKPAIFAIDFDHGQPYVYQYNLNIQREVLTDTVLTIGYVGSRGVKLPRESDFNIGSPGNPKRRNPNFSRVRFRVWDASSFYNSLQIGLNKRLSRGFQVQSSYTLSKSIDDASNLMGRGEGNERGQARTMDPFDVRRDRGLSNFDIRQNLTINYTWEVPFGRTLGGMAEKLLSGWQINGITTFTSGQPMTPIIIEDLDQDGTDDNEQRPNLRPGRSNNPRLGRPDRWFDPSAFQSIDPGTRGNLGRNTIIGPGLANFDFSLVKNFKVSRAYEDINIQFRAEFFNMFNRANFDLPTRANVTIFRRAGSNAPFVPDTGRITNTSTSSRQIQFALKIMF